MMKGNETLLKTIIEERGLRQVEAARDLNMDPTRFNLICNGWVNPGQKTKKKIADYLDVSMDEIFPTTLEEACNAAANC